MSTEPPPDATPFFRPEALEQQKTRWLGEIKLAHPFEFWLIGVFALGIAAGVLSFLIFASYTKRATVVGRLMPDSGQTTLVAAQSGRLAEIKVTEGATTAVAFRGMWVRSRRRPTEVFA